MGRGPVASRCAEYPHPMTHGFQPRETVAGGFDPRPLGNWFRSWPLPFASADAAREFLGDDALFRSWAAHLEPAEGGGLVPPFDADVMEAIMAGVAEPYWAQWRSIRMPATVVFAAKGRAPRKSRLSSSRPGPVPATSC